jgi:hypothetical protein
MYKQGFFYGASLVESIGTNYLELELTGLTKELSRNKEINMCIMELGCMFGVSNWTDPRFKLIAISAMTALSVDSKNRLEIALQEQQEPEREQSDETIHVRDLPKEETLENISSDTNDELLQRLNNFNLK